MDTARQQLDRPWAAVAAGLGSGALLGLAAPPLEWPALLFVALVPWLLVALRPGLGVGRGALAGACVGIGHNLVRGLALQLPLAFSLGLAAVFAVQWALLGGTAAVLARRLPRAAAPLVIVAATVVFEYAGATMVPVFGTAQSFARSLAAWPELLALTRVTGFTGIVLALTAWQAGAVSLVWAWPRPASLATGVAVAIGGLVLLVVPAWQTADDADRPVRTVAAVGWTYAELGSPWSADEGAVAQLERIAVPLVTRAAADGADLIVTPEAAFVVPSAERVAFRARLEQLSAELGATLVVGYFDVELDRNLAVIVHPEVGAVGDYAKTHLILGMEDYQAGDGLPVVGDLGVTRVGVVICQDDNFPDLGRAYGRLGVGVMAIPTNDWREVRRFHLQNTVLRGVESGFAIVRGATNGVSAVIDGRGRLLASRDHTAEGAGVVVAELPLPAGGSIYAITGNVLPGLCAACLLLGGIAALVRRS